MLEPKTYNLIPGSDGQAALSMVFLVGGIVILIGITLSFVAVSFLNASLGFQAANRALGVAGAGANDALIQLSRNKDFSAATPYTVPIGAYSAQVTVNQNSPIPGQAKIVSSAKVSSHERKLQVVVSVDSSSGQATLVSWEQVNL